ncbi:MAG: HupE/UreJ family protein [Roseovarius sp.]
MKKLLTLAFLVAGGPALAHTGHGPANGFVQGLAHPVFGADHLLAMLAVGLWSGFVLPRRFWAGAVAFMSAMAAGAALSWSGFGYPAVEGAILASVVAFGALVLFARHGQPPLATAASLGAIAVFASAHGHAHASEAAGTISHYLAGFLISTAVLHLVGVGIARAVAESLTAKRALGVAIAGSGLWLALT